MRLAGFTPQVARSQVLPGNAVKGGSARKPEAEPRLMRYQLMCLVTRRIVAIKHDLSPSLYIVREKIEREKLIELNIWGIVTRWCDA